MIIPTGLVLLFSLVGSQISSYTILWTFPTTTTGRICCRHVSFCSNTVPQQYPSLSPSLQVRSAAVDRQTRSIVTQLEVTTSSSSSDETTEANPPVTNVTNSDDLPSSQPPLKKLRVSELKSSLDEWKIKYDDCFDQESLLVRYNEAKHQQHQRGNSTVTNTDGGNITSKASASQSSFQKLNDATSTQPQHEEDEEDMMQSICSMSVKQLREELGQRRISRVGLLEKTDLIQAVYNARMMVRSFSVTGLLQPHLVTDVTGAQLQQEITNELERATTPLLVDVYATWCGPCQLLSKQLVEVAETLGSSIRIVKMDSDLHTNMAGQLRVQGLPTIILFHPDGTEMNRIEGAIMKDQLVQWIQQQQQK